MTIRHNKPILYFSISAVMVTLFCFSENSFANSYSTQQAGSVLSDKVYYQIGGGSAVMTPPSRKRPHELSIGLGWNANLMCGNFDIKTTVRNQLNGITEGFKDLMGNVVQSATGAVASLPAMVIQRANPQLYDLLTNGVLQGRLDFDAAKTSCEELANKAADYLGDSGWGMMAKTQNYQRVAETQKDAIQAKKQAEKDDGSKGVKWVGGKQKGGKGQQPLKMLEDAAKAGFNVANGLAVTNQAAVTPQQCDGMLCTTWKTPQEAADWATRVLGDVHKTTCNECGEQKSKAGTGLAPIIEEENIKTLVILEETLNAVNPIPSQLQQIGSTAIQITRGLVEALKDDSDVVVLSSRLASEIAISKTLEKALLARRTILAGMREPNIAANEIAQKELEKNLLMLDREIEQTKMEMELQRSIAGNTAMAILEKRIHEQQKALESNVSDDTDKRMRALSGNIEDAKADNSNGGKINIKSHYIRLNIPTSTGGLGSINGAYSGSRGGNGGIVSGRGLQAYETNNAYADGRATIYKTADGKLIRREGGTLAWRNNNPGNIRAGEFAQRYGAIGVGPSGFAIFPDAETGERAIHALLKTRDYNNQTIAGAIERYAPRNENNTDLYISMVTSTTGLDKNTPMSSLSDEQRRHIVNAIRTKEGWKEGSSKEHTPSG
ncbi:integrating conjugative element protein [Testudinibacter sp. P80/BLE/0925]|uniref:integrating conjugative element protein n=1 Tax=Testudinibacter sp. TW-1 TaxID=3417757 RepID=UPI003D364F4B